MPSLWEVDSPYPYEPYQAVATHGDVVEAARQDGIYWNNAIGADNALERAYDDRIDQVQKQTGVKLAHPMRDFSGAPVDFDEAGRDRNRMARQMLFTEELFKLQQKYPNAQIGLDRPITDDAHTIMSETHEDFVRKFSSRDGFGKYLDTFVGGLLALPRDPVQAPLLLIGGVEGVAARSVLGRIGQMAAREGAINAGTQAVIEPFIQQNQAMAGEPESLRRGLANVLAAGAFGATLGAGGRVLAEGARVFRRAPLAEATSAAALALDETIREGFSGRMQIGDRALRMMDDDIATAVRSTLDLAKTRRAMDADARAAEVFGAGDPKRVERIAQNFLTPEDAAPKPPQSLIDFLIDQGGVKDFQGEMRALGLDAVSQKFRGRLVKAKGLPLDQARERAAEAGYLGHPEQAGSGTTVADLLNALEEEHRGTPVYSMFDEDAATARSDYDRTVGENERVLGIVQKIEAAADKNLPDDLILRAAQAAMREDLDPVDALERVIMEDYRAGPDSVPPSGHPTDAGAPAGDRNLVADASPRDIFDPPDFDAPEPGISDELLAARSTLTAYHGTRDVFTEFDPQHSHLREGARKAIFFSTDPADANLFAIGNPKNDDPNFLPEDADFADNVIANLELTGKAAERFRADAAEWSELQASSSLSQAEEARFQDLYKSLIDRAHEASQFLDENGARTKSPNVHKVQLDPGREFRIDMNGRFNWEQESDAITRALAEGYDSVRLTNVGTAGDVIAIFDPTRINPASSPHDIFTPPDEAIPEPGISDEQLAAMAADQADLDDMLIPVGASLGEEGTEVTMRTLGDLLAEAKRGDELAALVSACNTEAA